MEKTEFLQLSERIWKEHDELWARLEKLKAFNDSDEVTKIPDIQFSLLLMQEMIMEMYAFVLELREEYLEK